MTMGEVKMSTTDEMSASQRLQALVLLHQQYQRAALSLKAWQADRRASLAEETARLNAAIEDAEPLTARPASPAEYEGTITAIWEAYQKREGVDTDTQIEVDRFKAKVARIEAAMTELLRVSAPTDQVPLDLDPDGDAPEGLVMSVDSAKAVGDALEEHVREGGQVTADMEAVKERLRLMGVEGLRLVPTLQEAVEATEDDDDAG
jgi:hypothetical protein